MRPALLLLAFFSFSLRAQDTVYARQVLKYLTSEKCYGRGYVKGGLQKAEKYIVSEIKTIGAKPLFGNKFTQPFHHSVNTFPKKCEVSINGKKLVPGIDFIPDPGSCSAKGKYQLTRLDSATYAYAQGSTRIAVKSKNKLTYSVDLEETPVCGIEIDKKRFAEEPREIELNIKNKVVKDFTSRNIGCVIDGSSASDSIIVFSAHYDHLGGIGKHTFFPGANDNASGTSLVLNLIRHYRAHPPKYKTVFIFFAGEEAGLLGSRYFVENPAFDLKKIKFLINLDLLGTGDDGIMVVNGTIHEKELGVMKKINAEKDLVKEIKKRGKAPNSDHYWFSEAGVPAFFIYTLGGVTAYHDVQDIEKTLPLTDYVDIGRLLMLFVDFF